MKMIQVPAGHLNKQSQRPKPPKLPGSQPLMSWVPVHEIKNNKKQKKTPNHKTKPLAPVCLLHTPYSNKQFSLVSP